MRGAAIAFVPGLGELGRAADDHERADALAAVSGLRAPGVAVPGRTKIGVWRGHGRRRFVVARRALPAVCVTLDGARHDELIISTEHAEQIAEQIRTTPARVANASDADVDQPEGAT
jgi:hypothetical protein